MAAAMAMTASLAAHAFIPLTGGGEMIPLKVNGQATSISTTVHPLGDAPNGTSLDVTIIPGEKLDDPLVMKVSLKVPSGKRVCISYAAFEAIGLIRSASGLNLKDHKCIVQSRDRALSDEVRLMRRDSPTEKSAAASSRRQAEYKDGYIIAVVTLDGDPVFFKIHSFFFGMDRLSAKLTQ